MATIDADTSVVLIMDYQNDIVKNYSSDPGLVDRAASVLDAARGAGIPVVYIQITFRPGHIEIGPKSSFARMRSSGAFSDDSDGAAIHPGVAPKEGETVITKKRVSAFAGSDLDLWLRSHGKEHLVLLGVATSGVVLSTARLATDMDYAVTVITDCCSDQDEEVHRVLTEKIFARQGAVLSAAKFIESVDK